MMYNTALAIQTDEVNQGLGAEEWEVMAMCLQCPGATVRPNGTG